MGIPHTSAAPHLYSPSLQLKLYQAFIFSVPILFTIILFLLFYLFYLKRKTPSNVSSPPQLNPSLPNQPTTTTNSLISMHLEGGFINEVKEKLPIIVFDEELKSRYSQCCVCLGDFEIKEQLNQIASCKHTFHIDCIHHWLLANTTCPLCRTSIHPIKSDGSELPVGLSPFHLTDIEANEDSQPTLLGQELVGMVDGENGSLTNFSSGEQFRPLERSTIRRTCLTESSGSQEMSPPRDAGTVYSGSTSTDVRIAIHTQ